MHKNDRLYYKYYDYLYSGKNYKKEVEVILGLYREIKKEKPSSVLDVGCGTGKHDFLFAEHGIKVEGIDYDCDIIDVAKRECVRKGLEDKCKFSCKKVENLDSSGFDLAFALFHVINYIDNLESLRSFFNSINKALNNSGLFVFDCWNGIAAIIDNPQSNQKSFDFKGYNIEIETSAKTDLMDQKSVISNEVEITDKETKKMEKFEFSYESTLWTQFQIKNILEPSGFKILKRSSWNEPNRNSGVNNWKILFVCQKIN